MATFSDEILVAFVDGELDPAQAVQIQLAMAASDELARRVERFRYVRKALRSTYDAVVKEPVPDHLLALLNQMDRPQPALPEPAPDASEGSAPKRSLLVVGAALVAAVLVGVLIGRATR